MQTYVVITENVGIMNQENGIWADTNGERKNEKKKRISI